jgi:hypothetical protein
LELELAAANFNILQLNTEQAKYNKTNTATPSFNKPREELIVEVDSTGSGSEYSYCD